MGAPNLALIAPYRMSDRGRPVELLNWKAWKKCEEELPREKIPAPGSTPPVLLLFFPVFLLKNL